MMTARKTERRPREIEEKKLAEDQFNDRLDRNRHYQEAHGGQTGYPLFFSYLSNLLLSQVPHSTETPGDQAESGQESSTSALATLQSLGSAGGQSGRLLKGWRGEEPPDHHIP